MPALNVKDPFAHRLAAQITERTGETITQAVIAALLERLVRLQDAPKTDDIRTRLAALMEEAAKIPIVDHRSADEIIGWDEHGMP